MPQGGDQPGDLFSIGRPTEIRRLKQLEDENAKLKKLVADLSLDRDAAGRDPPKAMKPVRKRQLVDHA